MRLGDKPLHLDPSLHYVSLSSRVLAQAAGRRKIRRLPQLPGVGPTGGGLGGGWPPNKRVKFNSPRSRPPVLIVLPSGPKTNVRLNPASQRPRALNTSTFGRSQITPGRMVRKSWLPLPINRVVVPSTSRV